MTNFRIIPVIDILNSKAVHAIKGRREYYKPLKSSLFNSTDPLEIIQIISKKYKFKEVYIADLDAIIKHNPNIELIREITKISGLEIILDSGIIENKDLQTYSSLNIKKIIIGLETVKNYEVIGYGLEKY